MKVLIDGDILVYRMAWACQKTHYTHEGTGEFFDTMTKAKKWHKEEMGDVADFTEGWQIVEEIEPWKSCKFLIDNCMQGILNACGTEEYQVFLTPPNCFRYDVATLNPYKSGRKEAPHWKKEAIRYLTKEYRAYTSDRRMEADDMLGMNQTTDTIIASIDKDLYMIPGRHYDIVKQTFKEIDLQAADDWFFIQLISGDPTDSIKGLEGYGPVKAKGVLEEFSGDHKGLVEEIHELYELQHPGMGKEAMIETAQLVYIYRSNDMVGREQWRDLLLLNEKTA